MCVGTLDGEPEGKMGVRNTGIILKWVLRERSVMVWTNPDSEQNTLAAL